MRNTILLCVVLSVPSWGAVAHVKSAQGFCNNNSSGGNIPGTCGAGVTSRTFTYTPNTTGNAILIYVGCAATTGTVTAVSLSATSWTFVQVGSITGTTTSGFGAVFRAYAFNTSATTITQAWTASGGTCSNFMNDLIDEFSGTDLTNFVDTSASTNATGTPTVSITPGVNNAMIWAGCADSITAVGNIGGSAATKGADDTQQDWSEFRLLSGGSGSSISAAFTGSGAYVIFAVSIKVPGSGPPPGQFPRVR